MSQRILVEKLVQLLRDHPAVLGHACNIATAVVAGKKNHCAATLSALLIFVGIYPYGAGLGKGDLEPWVPTLAEDLQSRQGWQRIDYDRDNGPAEPLAAGDVGVVMAGDTHHIYLIVNADDQARPLIADNQRHGVMHQRPTAGGGFSPTSYFLRAPA
jgi:hypothetical protein